MQHRSTDILRAARRGHLAMLTFSALVAGSFSLGGEIANDIDPIVLTTLRFFLGAMTIGVFIVAKGQGRTLSLRAPWRFLVLGAIFAGYFVLMFEGLKTAAPVSLAAVFTLTPAMAAGFALPLLGQRTGGWVLTALMIGAAGALWVIFRADLSAFLAFHIERGEAIFVVGCALHALYVPLLRKFNRGEGALLATFGVLAGGTPVLLLVGWGQISSANWAAMPAMVWIVLGYLTVFTTAVTLSLVSFASMRLPSSKVMAYTYLTPSFVILWELGLGNSAPPLLVLGGVGLTLVALAMLLRNDP